MLKRIAVSVLIALVGLISLLPGTAWAPRVKGLPGYTGPCRVLLEDDSIVEGRFLGDIFVLNYEARGSDLLANLSITGACTANGEPYSLSDAPATAPVTILKSNCNRLDIRLGEATARTTITVDLSGEDMKSTGEKTDRDVLCQIARNRKKGSPALIADLLNQYFQG
ncbi:MAG: hypothetical protein M3280_07775 [Actinomycetota bacterium]|nr:hypothetical protein [Actinomycetota bacterium]